MASLSRCFDAGFCVCGTNSGRCGPALELSRALKELFRKGSECKQVYTSCLAVLTGPHNLVDMLGKSLCADFAMKVVFFKVSTLCGGAV